MAQPKRKEQSSETSELRQTTDEKLRDKAREGEVRESVMEKAAEVSERYRPALDRLAE
jgi:hypothetical protein